MNPEKFRYYRLMLRLALISAVNRAGQSCHRRTFPTFGSWEIRWFVVCLQI